MIFPHPAKSTLLRRLLCALFFAPFLAAQAATLAVTPTVGAWSDLLLDNRGALNLRHYTTVARSYNLPATMDYRFGPKFADFHPGAAANSAGTVPQFGTAGWYPSVWNYTGGTDWFAMSGQLLYAPDAAVDPGMARARNGSIYSTNAGPFYDFRLQWTPDPCNYYTSNPDPGFAPVRWGAKPPTPAIAGARARFISGMPGAAIFENGLIAMLGTGNDSDTLAPRYAYAQLPSNKTPTAVCMTLDNEFVLVTVWDTSAMKGQVAVLAVNGWMVASGGSFRYGVPNWQGIQALKLLGYVDLPFKAPTSIAVTTDLSMDSGRGSQELNGTNWDSQTERNAWLNWQSTYRRTARAGYAIVASRAENKVAFVDLAPLFSYYRQMYFTTQANYDLTKNQGPAAGQWPFPFATAPQQTPVVAYSADVPQPTAVAAGFHRGNNFWWRQPAGGAWEGTFAARAYVATMGGQLEIFDTTKLVTTGLSGAPSLVAVKAIGNNPTDISYGTQACDANPNDLYITCRGDRAIYRLTEDGATVSVLTDSRLQDPVSAEISNNNRLPNGVSYLSVMDYSGKQAVNYVALEGTSQTAGFRFGSATPVPGKPFLFYCSEVP